MTPARKTRDTAIVFQGASVVEMDRRLQAAGLETARVEIRIAGVTIPKNVKATIRIVPAADGVAALDALEDINDSHTHPPY